MKPSSGGPILFVTYDGLLEPLGFSQVLPYVEGLAASGLSCVVVSFEKTGDLARPGALKDVEERLATRGIRWRRLRYHKRPAVLSTVWDMFRGAVTIFRIVREEGIKLIHARSYVAGAMVRMARRVIGVPWVFDMRGFWVDERVEGGLWHSGGRLFRVAKRWERALLRDAAGIVVLTEASVPRLAALAGVEVRQPVEVIPTCVDTARFVVARPPSAARAELGLDPEAFTLVYSGSFGTWYLGPETFELARYVASHVEAFQFIVLTRDVAEARRLMVPALEGRTIIKTVDPGDVPLWLGGADAALSLVRPSFSKLASSPTKLGEYLACGLPVASVAGVGDVDAVLAPPERPGEEVGVVMPGVSALDLESGAAALVRMTKRKDIREACRARAEEVFGLDSGIERLGRLYTRLEAES